MEEKKEEDEIDGEWKGEIEEKEESRSSTSESSETSQQSMNN